MEPEFMSDALDDLRADEADFASRQRAATRELVTEYAIGRGSAIVDGLASADRVLVNIDGETAAIRTKIAPVTASRVHAESKLSEQPAAPSNVDPLVGYDVVLAFYGIDPVALRTANPFAYLMLGQAYFADLVRMQMIAHACMVGTLMMARIASERRSYKPVSGARNALRHSLHRMGVL
jgi:hypothetical protein